MIDLSNWRKFFVETTPRKQQEEILDWMAKNWNLYDNFLIQAGTGTGKSAIAVTVARTLLDQKVSEDTDIYQPFNTFITTSSIELQNQYFDSYSKFGLKKIYSASNFKCNRKIAMTCKEGKEICGQSKPKGICPGVCSYDAIKKDFIANGFGISNLAYYAFETEFAKQLPKRGLMIFDEAHNIGDFVKTFVTTELFDITLAKYNIKIPKANIDNTYNIAKLKVWLDKECIPILLLELNKTYDKIDAFESATPENIEYARLISELASLKWLTDKIQVVRNDITEAEWVAERKINSIVLTPISPYKYMEKILIGKNDKRIFMSATILDADFIIKEYSLDPKRTISISIDTTFPLKNRPIYSIPCGKLEYNNLEKSMIPFVDVVKEILKEHKNEKGIIFVSSYAQTNELIKQVNSTRLITHESSKHKDEMMNKHRKSDNTVIISSSMNEGINLTDDLSRFQIILKLPFLSLGSLSVKRRMELYPQWYAYRTALTLIQSSGRSIRSETDFAVSYILDSNFKWFIQKHSNFFPRWWLNSIIE